jgi:uncharacterized NAD-dependent epimerase/dehydratase family protein
MITKEKKLAIYMEGNLDTDYGKMGFGVMRYSPNPILCAIDSRYAGKSVREAVGQPFDIPVVSTVEEAHEMGAEVMVLGTAPSGGKFPDAWDDPIGGSVKKGMSLINGLHDDLNARYGHLLNPAFKDQVIWDVRKPAARYPIASARASQLNNKRILLVGTDMAVGKMTAGLEIYKWLIERGHSSAFLATGQIGITVTGKGIPLDAIKVDQACGAVEDLVMGAADKDIVFIEGQGSLLHPGSTATLPLMRGSCATHLILCHRGDMTTLRKPTHIKIPPLKEFIALNEAVTGVCGALTRAKCVGIAVNTSRMEHSAALELLQKIEEETGIPTSDVILQSPEKLAQAILNS